MPQSQHAGPGLIDVDGLVEKDESIRELRESAELRLAAAGKRGVGPDHPSGDVGADVHGLNQIPGDGLRSFEGRRLLDYETIVLHVDGWLGEGPAGRPNRQAANPLRDEECAQQERCIGEPGSRQRLPEHPPHDAGRRAKCERAPIPRQQPLAKAVVQFQLCGTHGEGFGIVGGEV